MKYYLENASKSNPINRHKPLPPKALGYSLRVGESKREVVSNFHPFTCPSLAGVADYLENASGVPSPLSLSRTIGRGNS